MISFSSHVRHVIFSSAFYTCCSSLSLSFLLPNIYVGKSSKHLMLQSECFKEIVSRIQAEKRPWEIPIRACISSAYSYLFFLSRKNCSHHSIYSVFVSLCTNFILSFSFYLLCVLLPPVLAWLGRVWRRRCCMCVHANFDGITMT